MALIQINATKRDFTSISEVFLLNTERINSYYYDAGVGGIVLNYVEKQDKKYKSHVYETSNPVSDFSDIAEYNRGYKFIEINITAEGVNDDPFERTLNISINHIVRVYDSDDGYGYVEIEYANFEYKRYKTQETLLEIQSAANITFAKTMYDLSSLFELHISADITKTLTNTGQYYLFDDSNLYLELGNKFSFDSGILTYDGTKNAIMSISGAADISVVANKGKATFSIFKNGSIYDNEQTPTDFTSVDRIKNISITSAVPISPGDTLSVRIKTDTANMELKMASFHFTGFGYYVE